MTPAPSNEVLAERIVALDQRVDDRFIALDKALQLAAGGHRSGVALWLSVMSLLVAVATVAVMMIKH